jgi:anti-sigma regulatory factor (Ser/Thr protein kinase)
MKERRSFPASKESVRECRQFALKAVDDLAPEVQDSVELMVSELATNALVHAKTDFEVEIARTDRELRVEVTDRGRGAPMAKSPNPSEPHGRGLLIVSELSDDWGSTDGRGDAGNKVWFSLRLSTLSSSGMVDLGT